jgi:VanZ family protein
MISRPELRWTTFWWICDWTITLAVVVGSLIPPREFPAPIAFFNDKFLHFIAYFLMTIWFAGSMNPRRYVWLVVGLCTLGAVVEWVQYLLGFGRDADWRDFVADALGVFIALALARVGFGNWMAWVERRFIGAGEHERGVG